LSSYYLVAKSGHYKIVEKKLDRPKNGLYIKVTDGLETIL